MRSLIKKYWLPAVIVVGGSLLIVLLLFLKSRSQSPIPSIAPVPFKLLSTYPPEGEQETAFPSTAIMFTFSSKLDDSNIVVTISPSINYIAEASSDKKVLTVRPEKAWEYGTSYKIKVNVKSEDGQTLPEIDYKYAPVAPTNSLLTE